MAGVEGRGSAAGRLAMVAIVLVVGVLAMAPAALAVNHVVGGTEKWTIPPANTYYDNTWASNQSFTVGDTLEFEYTVNQHDVVQYSNKTEFDACAGTAVQTWTTGNDTIPLTTAGTFYYICSIPGHCTQGMKVSVTVGAAAATPPTTTPSPPASTTPPPPAVASPPPPSGSGSAASSGPVLSMACLFVAALVAALAFLV